MNFLSMVTWTNHLSRRVYKDQQATCSSSSIFQKEIRPVNRKKAVRSTNLLSISHSMTSGIKGKGNDYQQKVSVYEDSGRYISDRDTM